MSAATNVVESFRDVVQDLLVPELKAVKVSVESLSREVTLLRGEMKLSYDSLREEMRLRNHNLERMMQHGDERNEHLIRTLADRLDTSVQIRERLALLEARMPKQ